MSFASYPLTIAAVPAWAGSAGAVASGSLSSLKFAAFAARLSGSGWKAVPMPGKGDVSDELVLHWNGRTWKRVGPPAAPSRNDYLVFSMAPDGQSASARTAAC